MADTLHEKSRVLGVNNSTKVTQRGRGGPGLGPGCLRLPGPLGNNVRPGPQEGGAVPKSLESRSVSHLPICWLLQLGPYVTTTPVQAHFLLRKGCDTPVVAGRGGKGQGGPWGCEGGGLGGSEEWRGGARKTRAGTEAGVGAVGSETSRTVPSTGAGPVLGQRLCS